MADLIDLSSHSVTTVLNILLKDRTTNKNIILATEEYGNGTTFNTQITKALLFNTNINIKPRVAKTLEEQSKRTRSKAEVFSPSWLCNKMNNHCDDEWFERKNVFNFEENHNWKVNEEKIVFPSNKSWKDYVMSTRLEITCGEAPYLVSRYDTVTGEIIPINKRIGFLDRKLRVINENTKTRKSWNQWVYRAFESIYGYEYQGDNLLIARVNLLKTFCEYTRDKWNEEPTQTSLKRVAEIISWNIWQMDGIYDVVPYAGAIYYQDDFDLYQMNMFEFIDFENELNRAEMPSNTVECKIYDWQDNREISFKSMKEGTTHEI